MSFLFSFYLFAKDKDNNNNPSYPFLQEKEEAKALLREISSTTAVKMSGVSFSEDILLDDDDEQEELEEGGDVLGEDLEDAEDGGEALQEGQW